ncbi:MAG: alpha/beta fold hydrolase [Cyanobacteriota bacterium]|nr:alpha/beta fold hydrolase [Cyanobacteriota bacterium]
MVKVFWLAMGTIAIAYTSICLALMRWQTRLIFFPTPTLTLTPQSLGLSYEEVWLPISQAEERLHGWWLPATADSRGTVLFLHGNGSNVSENLEQAYRWVKLGFNVFLFDYRGYGRSEGPFPNEQRVYEDAQVALDYLLERREIDPREIIVYGHSLGGAIAIELATHNPQVAGLVIEGSFTSLRNMVDRAGIYSLFPVNWLLSQRFDSLSKVASLPMPILYIHGTSDETVPHSMSQTLFAATQAPKQLYLVPGAGHNDVAAVADREYLETLSEFARSLPALSSSISP